MSTELLEPVVNDGVRLTHFFNGRVLTAEDLRREQDAVRDRHRGLAGAVGEGVVRGLEVTPLARALPAPTVRITAGLAFNRDGDPVDLPRDVELRLIPAQAQADQEAGLFALCERAAEVSVITNPGFYLLAARPASALSRDQVPLVDVSSSGVGSRCGSRYAELGASFSLIPFPVPAGGADAPLAERITKIAAGAAPLVERVRGGETGAVETELARALSKLRNGMAYWCAGRDVAGPRVVSLAPGAAPAPVATPLEGLRASGALASCDVPLALLYVTRRQLEWVDVWSVRRAPVPRQGPDPLPLAGPLPAAEAAAAFMQFRDHAASFLAAGTPLPPGQVRASDWFLFLPPAGVLPLPSGARAGFSAAAFFEGRRANGPAALDAARIPPLLRASLEHAPLDLASNDRTWLYSVAGLDAPGSPPCLLFAGYPVEQERTVLPVRITEVMPASEHARVGDPLRVRGENFEGTSNGQQVLVDGTPVPPNAYLSRTEDELRFTIPPVTLPPAGKHVLLVVGNRSTAAIHPLLLLPRAGLATGSLDAEFVAAQPAAMEAGKRALFRFSVRNRTDIPSMVKLKATVSETSWPVRVLPAAAATAEITEIGLSVGDERSVFVEIDPIPSDIEAVEFTVRLDAEMPGATGTSGPQRFAVDGTSTTPAPGVTVFRLAGSNPAGALQGNLLSVSPYYGVQAIIDLVVVEAGTYTVSTRFQDEADGDGAPAGWGVAILGAANGTPQTRSFAVTAAELAANNGIRSLPVQAIVSTQFFGATTAEVVVDVQGPGETIPRELSFSVQRTGWIWYGYGYYG